MTTTPPPEPPGSPEPEPKPDRPAEPETPPLPNAGGPYPSPGPYPGPGQPPANEGSAQYPPPPPLPPEGFSPYGGGPGYDYGSYGAPPVRQNNGMGVAALVLGIVAFLIGPCSILAIVFGRIGLNRVARGEATNRGVAQAGFVLGIVTLVLWVLGMIVLASR
jgi:hypothetical protein